MDRIPDLGKLSQLSAAIGKDINLVQAGGGNTSIKEDGVLWVKASGKWLARAEEEEMFLAAPLDSVLDAVSLNHEYLEECPTPSGALLKPSVETTMHAVLPHPVVVHVHSVNTIASTVRDNPREALSRKLDGLRWGWLPYVRPGVDLARALVDMPAHKLDVVILDNHGLVIGAGDCDEAGTLLTEVERRLECPSRTPQAPDLHTLTSLADDDFRLPPDEEVHFIGTDPYAASVAARGILFPDQCVYLGVPAIADGTSVTAAVVRFAEVSGSFPKYLVVPGKGILISKDLNRAGWELLMGLTRILQRLDPAEEVHFLDPAEVSRLMNWDAEHYRIAVAGKYSMELPAKTTAN